MYWYMYNHRNQLNIRALELWFIFLITSCGRFVSSDEGKIVGGRIAKRGEFPATLFVEGPGRCGGTLVTLSTFLSAGGCFVIDGKRVEAKSITVIGGVVNIKEKSTDKQESRVKEYKVHEKYKKLVAGASSYTIFDIALATLETPFISTETLKPAVFPAADSAGMKKILDKVNSEKTTCIGTGYGAVNLDREERVFSDDLKVAELTLVPVSDCRVLKIMIGNEICATSLKDNDQTAPGDTGSTFMCGGYILGMAKGRNRYTKDGKEICYLVYTLFGPYMEYFNLGGNEGTQYQLHPSTFLC
ncbi:plasma kallikrein-like isoform X2 [Cimex lectularius]|uniref:Peptidase S1 domain-containing protein n=1 Tax=Cimex lectularius TaxID=79782 RepID=A0A8I6SV86_CIMLE|nr:plasma kallikrein-like isoform X2 [Cimex lectularius]